MPEEPWFRRAFDHEYHDRWVRSGATSWNLSGDTRQQVELVVRALQLADGASVLDLACGHGRHAIELARRGFRVTGLDLSPGLLEVARAESATAQVDVEWIEADMRDPLPGGFDAAVCLDTSIGYFDSDDEDQQVLCGLRDALRPEGQLLLDVLNRDAFLDNVNTRYWRDLPAGELLLLDRRMDVSTSRLTVDATIVDPDGARHHQRFRMRLYTLAELAGMLGRAGFAIAGTWGSFSGAPVAVDRARLLVLARRR